MHSENRQITLENNIVKDDTILPFQVANYQKYILFYITKVYVLKVFHSSQQTREFTDQYSPFQTILFILPKRSISMYLDLYDFSFQFYMDLFIHTNLNNR